MPSKTQYEINKLRGEVSVDDKISNDNIKLLRNALTDAEIAINELKTIDNNQSIKLNNVSKIAEKALSVANGSLQESKIDQHENSIIGRTINGNLDSIHVETINFNNLLENGNFEIWNGGVGVVPTGWALGGVGASVAREAVLVKKGFYAAALTAGAAGLAFYNTNGNDTDFYEYFRGRPVSVGVWVWCDTNNRVRLRIIDGVSSVYTDYHSGSSSWEFLQTKLLVNSAATRLHFEVQSSVGVSFIDGMIAVEGSICPAFSEKIPPKPALIDAVPSDTGYNGEMRIYSNAGVRRLYLSDGTDWKYTAIAT